MTLKEFHARQQVLLDLFAAYYRGLLLGVPSEDPSSEEQWMNEYNKWLNRVLH